ncbi:hypothetical protein M8C21_003496 [Ambrosia artemisiifolia]|uniref:non-specific serine/threonine protein kinase n=1 Tax=Ambrosia artemisiifolia TaxID=4212 RepID=A0AAD5BQ07_AMBAR|nr:hypothetical protein M8C21_003496 [Ambrosia artemisiifolia]
MSFSLLFLLLLFLPITTFPPFSSGSPTGPPTGSPEAQTLISIKTFITFDPHSTLQSWTLTTNHCTWSGVTCHPFTHHVTSLNLAEYNLTGSLSPSIGNLTNLINLNLAVNNLVGPIPPQLILDLYNNNLTGDLPVSISNMSNLVHLHLGGNYFTGIIPSEYGRFPFLEYLAVSGNELTGVIPVEIGNLTNLKQLYLGYYNVYSGGIPAEIGNLSRLVRFDAANCGLTGEVPMEIGKLQNLDTLFLQVNGLSGSLTKELGMLKSLKSMDLSNNVFVGEIPESFKENKLHGSIPEFIAELPELEVLQLWENNFTGSIPERLGRNGKLQILDLSSNKLTGELPDGLCVGNRLETLITLGNFLFGRIPEALGECRSLSRVRMGENYLNGSIPKGLLSLPNLSQVELQDNLLTGEFPVTDSVSVSLSNNRLTGQLPGSIGNFSGLQKLLLDGNRFTGPIPDEIGKLQQLSKIDFSSNNFSGKITPKISKCQLLTYVDLSRNQLSGEVPTEITDMHILNYLNVSRNRLVGSIPMSIASMQSLTSVDFSYNELSGLVPGTGQFSYFNYTSFLGNPELCGPYLGPCKDGVANGTHQPHSKGSLSSSVKLLLVIGLLLCSIAFAVAAIKKARSLKRASEARAWKLTAFQRLDFTCDNVLDSLKEDNIIGKGGAGITLGRIRHRYIVRLLGFCSNHETNLLVYEYMPNGSLGEMLHGKKGGHLYWDTRYKIALESAKGLCYLHHDCSPLILHRDVKSNNILLDSNFEAHVADFGLAKFLQDSGNSECMSAIAGSYGYIAPDYTLKFMALCHFDLEYAYTLKVDEKSDVYSFGVVLLELVTGRKPVGEFGDGVDIVQWVRKMTGGNKEHVMKIVDPRLPTAPTHEVMHVFYVAMLCVEEQAVERPTMREVVQILTEVPKAPVTKQGGDSDAATSVATDPPVMRSPSSSPPMTAMESPIAALNNNTTEQSQLRDLLSI